MLRKLWRQIGEAGRGKRIVAIREIVKRKLGGKITDAIIVYRLDEADYRRGAAVRWPEGLCVERTETMAGIPQEILGNVPAEELEALLAGLETEVDRGGVLWLGTIGGELAATQFSIRGSKMPGWYVPLQPNDIVIYAAGTLNAFRGRGIHPAMIRHIMENEPREGGEVYCDALVWNTVAQRNIEKAGYRPIAKSRLKSSKHHAA